MKGSELRNELLAVFARGWPIEEDDDEGADDSEDEEGGVSIADHAIPVAALYVVEWQGGDGKRWLSRGATLGNGDPAPRWTLEMLAYEALHWDDSD